MWVLYTLEPHTICDTSIWNFSTVSHLDKQCLNHEDLEHEIKEAVFQMGLTKPQVRTVYSLFSNKNTRILLEPNVPSSYNRFSRIAASLLI